MAVAGGDLLAAAGDAAGGLNPVATREKEVNMKIADGVFYILIAVGIICMLAMSFGVWPGRLPIFIGVALFVLAGLWRAYMHKHFRGDAPQ